MPFDRFMEMALYEPGLGYYATLACDPSGQSGSSADYQTSPQVHRAFGYLLARQLAHFWEALGRPNPFVVAELGAGAGELADQIIEGLAAAGLPARVVYHAVDRRVGDGSGRSPGPTDDAEWSSDDTGVREVSTANPSPNLSPTRGEQVDVGAGDRWSVPQGIVASNAGSSDGRDAASRIDSRGQITWWRDIAELRQAGVQVHCVLSNEFFDALPVHRVAWVGGRLREVFIDRGERGFAERLGEPSDAALARWIADGGVLPPEGWRGEICLRLVPVIEAIAGILDRGLMLTIDYGDETADRFQKLNGTLLAYYRHQWTDDVLRRVGEQDLTSHVDFGALLRVGRRYGLEPVFLTNQRDFLLRLGLVDESERLIAREPTVGRRWQARFALAELVRPDGLGRLKVLVQRRGLN